MLMMMMSEKGKLSQSKFKFAENIKFLWLSASCLEFRRSPTLLAFFVDVNYVRAETSASPQWHFSSASCNQDLTCCE